VSERYRNFTRVDYHDASGKRVMTQTRHNWFETGLAKRTWAPRRLLFVNHVKTHATELHMEDINSNVGLPDTLFTVRSLGRDWGSFGGKR
jgi:hypothetical protein